MRTRSPARAAQKRYRLGRHRRDPGTNGGRRDTSLSVAISRCFLHPDSKQEYALARSERKSGPGYRGFEITTDPTITIEQDLLRRDLTINAIAEDEQGNLIDPYGGQQDLEARCLRHVSAAFVEDPVRVLRIARFAARFHHLGFSIADETRELIREIGDSGELETLVAERVWSELSRALDENDPCGVLHQPA